MIVQEVYRYPDRLAKFDFANDGQDTLRWLRFMWSWQRDHRARRASEKLAKKIAAWEKKKAQDIKDERGRQVALKVLDKMARKR